MSFLQCDVPLSGHLTKFFLQIIRQSGYANWIDSHTSLQSSHGLKLNAVAGVVELTHLNMNLV